MSGGIFISYRRDDASFLAGRLYDRLLEHFPQNLVFMDLDLVAHGEELVKAIEKAIESSVVLIALVGKRWLISCGEGGGRRIDNPEDFVRIEIATALKRNIRVLLVLVENASMPESRDLPDGLKSLVRRNAFRIRN